MKDKICLMLELCKQNNNPNFIWEFDQSILVLGDHQYYSGYCVLLAKECHREIHHLNRDKYLQLMNELYQASHFLEEIYSPDKLNICSLGNQVPHIHWHLIPRYKKDEAFLSWPFSNIPSEELQKHALKIDDAKNISLNIRQQIQKITK